MKKYIIFAVAIAAIAAMGSLFFTKKVNAAFWSCSLNFSSPHGSVIQIGDRVTWTLDSNYVGGRSFWYGTKDGIIDVNGGDTALGSSFVWTTDPYPSGSQGYYKRSIIIRDQNNNFICQTGDVYVSVVTSATVAPSVSLSPSSLSFFIQQGGSLPSTQWLQFAVNPNQQIFWSAQSSGGWLSFSPSGSAYTTGGLSVGLNQTAATLYPGTYTTNILVSPQSGTSPSFGTQNILVTLTVAGVTPIPAITEASISGPGYGATGVNQNYAFRASSNTASSLLIFKINWGDGTITQDVGPNGYPKNFSHQWGREGSYTITFTASLPDNSQVSKTTTLNVSMASFTPSLAILSPNGGESFTQGSTVTVTWSRNGNFTTANTYYFVYLKTWAAQLLGNPDNHGSYLAVIFRQPALGYPNFSFQIPAHAIPGTYYLELDYADANGVPLASDTSNAPFSITTAVSSPTPTVSIYNLTNSGRNPTFWTGDYLRMAVNNLPANQTKTIELCHTYLGSSGCDVAQISVDYNGTWRTEFQVLGISLGNWTRWVRIDGVASNLVSYTVVNAPTPTPTPTCYWWEECQPTPTPTLTPTPTPTASPTPTVPPTSTPSPAPISSTKLYTLSEIYDGDLIRSQGDIAVWIVKIVGEKRYKRWLFGPQIFNVYGHLGFNKVKNISKETLNKFDTSNLIRLVGAPKVYELTDFIPGKSATRRWIQTLEIFLQRGFDFDSVYIVNQGEFNLYIEGSPLPVTQSKPPEGTNLAANLSEAMLRFLGLSK